MTTHNEMNRGHLRGGHIVCLGWVLLFAGVVCADQMVLVVDRVPEHGLVVKRVDLRAALSRCKIEDANPLQMRADDRNGRSVPFQFIPDPGFDPAISATGLMVARLTPNRVNYLKLSFAGKREGVSARPDAINTKFYTVFHNANKGGLPDRIVFGATGKVFDNFRWQDRLHHRNLGGFTLQNDTAASVELLATGPLCTAVRVKARYANSEGKQSASKPEATYTWIYLRELPLLFVTAEIRQAEPLEWNELHFLELNFPGEDFKSWAGGEPFSEGSFQATGKSHNVTKWGALIEGRDAIAMFDCGRLIFHDGRGGYGTYLHAHGDKAWGGWSKTRTEFSAWLWIGSGESPTKEIRALIDKAPSAADALATTADVRKAIESAGDQGVGQWRNAMARQLEAAGRLEEATDVAEGQLLSNWTRIRAGDLNLVLEKAEQGLRVLSLFDERAGRELLAADSAGLFSLEIRHGESKERLALGADSGWRRVDVSGTDASEERILTFREPVDDRLHGISVEVKLGSNDKDSSFAWDLRATNDSEQLSLWRVVFPQINLRQLREGARVFLPQTAGIEVSEIWSTAERRGGTYPSGWTCMQYMAAYDAEGRTGLYVGMHDPFGSTKDILAQGKPGENAVAFRFEHPVPDMGKAGTGFDLPGEAKWQLLRGDWFDAATIYRDWVIREAKWWPALGPDGRGDTPKWMRELPAWAMTGGSPSSCVPRTAAFAKELGVPVGFHWYNWHQIPFDNDYPHYFPAKDGFAEGVAELKEAGVYAMPYINGRLWDTHDHGAEDREFTRIGLPAATKDEKGNPHTESYGSKETDGKSVTLAAMCPSTSLWQDRVRGIVLRLFSEYGVSGVYIDQIAAAKPRLCFDASHGHPLGGGHWWTEGYWKMLDAIRGAKPAECMLATECNAEPYVKWFDGYLTWHWQEQDMVPAFPAVYGGAIQMFGRAYRGGPSQEPANRMKAGQQLVFGEQIGWFSPEIIKRPDSGKFLRDCIQLRWRLRDYFYAGHMVRPPRLIGEIPQVTADWQWRGEWPITTPAVMTGAWRVPREDKVVLLFVNVSDQGLTADIQFDPKEYDLVSETLRVTRITPGESESRFTIRATDKHRIELARRTVVAWEVTGVTGD